MLRGCLNCNSSRVQLAHYLNALGMKGIAVEVGSHRGGYASAFLEQWQGKYLYCIDPWYNPPGYEEQATHLHVSRGENRHEDYQACRDALRSIDPNAKRHIMLHALSLEVVSAFGNESLDFVYLDADHTRPAIDNDLEAWWHKVKPGGLLAGHDFLCPMEPEGGWGRYIQPAVMEFASRYNVDVWLIAEQDLFPWSYYIVKPDPHS